MYGHLKSILKQNPEYLILHISTKGSSKYTPNEAINRILDLKSFFESNAQKCKVIILTLPMRVDNQKIRTVVHNNMLFIKNMLFR